MAHLIETYSQLPVTFGHGQGVWLWDTDHKRYLDALSGIAVCNLGHAHPAITEAIATQAAKLMHTSNLYRIELQERLAEKLCQLSGLDNAFFCNSGAEANEAAIKIARKYGHEQGFASPKIIVMSGAFHGRTLATLSATANPNVQLGFQPLVEGFIRVQYDDINALQELAHTESEIVAVLVEPIQGEGGVRRPSAGYLSALRALCDRQKWLLILDEIQTGIGRTGQWFAFQHEDIKPDVITLAKALGNGFPIGACLTKQPAAKLLTPGSHGSTFGGNPLGCAAALAVLNEIETSNLIAAASQLGHYIQTQFTTALANVESVRDIRGQGLMLGIELDWPCAELVQTALSKQLLINVTASNTIRLLPPLITCMEDADTIVNQVSVIIKEAVE